MCSFAHAVGLLGVDRFGLGTGLARHATSTRPDHIALSFFFFPVFDDGMINTTNFRTNDFSPGFFFFSPPKRKKNPIAWKKDFPSGNGVLELQRNL